MISWTPVKAVAWPFPSQCIAAGLEAPEVTLAKAWAFPHGQLLVHVCEVKACVECAKYRRVGWRTLTVTADEIRNGIALDKVGAALWRTPQGGLF